MGYERAAAARYAFLLAIPAVFGSGFYQLYKVVKEPEVNPPFTLLETGLATVIAFVVALVVIKYFMAFISKRSFLPFVIYRVALGAFVMVMLATGVITA
jgi:undecaprenyl-diphosphatase